MTGQACPACGTVAEGPEAACRSCGQVLHCSNGHTAGEAGQKFCRTCGERLVTAPAPAQARRLPAWFLPAAAAGVVVVVAAIAWLALAGGSDDEDRAIAPLAGVPTQARSGAASPGASSATTSASPATTTAPAGASATPAGAVTAAVPSATVTNPPTPTPTPTNRPPTIAPTSTPLPAPALRAVPLAASKVVSSGLAPGATYDTATIRVQIDPFRTLWVAWNNTEQLVVQRAERPGALLLGPGGFGTDDQIEVTVRAPGGTQFTATLDRNDAFGRSSGPQNVLFGTAADAPDVFRISPTFASPPSEVFIFDEGGTHNSVFTAAGEYEFTFRFINGFTDAGGHSAVYLLVFARP